MDEKQSEILVEGEKKKPNAIVLLRNRDFSALFFGGFISNIGSWFTMVAIFFLALQFTEHLTPTESTQAVALLTTCSLIPMLALGPLAGALVDKFDRKKVMVLADFLGAGAAIALFFSTQMWHLYLFMIFNSSVRQFFYPARMASIPRIAKQDQLLTANGIIQTTNQIARMLGPLIAGFIAASLGLKIAFLFDAGTYIASAILIVIIKTDLKPAKNSEGVNVKSVLIGMRDGFRITFRDKIIRFVVITFGITILAIGAIDPVGIPYLNFEFGLGEKDFGLMMSFSAISGVIAAVILSVKGQLKNKLTFMSIAIVALGVSVAILSFSPFVVSPVVWLYLGMCLIGFTNVGFSIPFSTLLQTIVKNENLGKVSGVIDTIMTASSLIASLLAVALTGYISISLLLGIVAAVVLMAGIVSLVIIKAKGLEELTQRKEEKMKSDLKDIEEEFAEISLEEQKSKEIRAAILL
ncbi:MAG: MFS transporter [Asgard group archaeon]|nr:MFS transporter [Asgard group archaeon]